MYPFYNHSTPFSLFGSPSIPLESEFSHLTKFPSDELVMRLGLPCYFGEKVSSVFCDRFLHPYGLTLLLCLPRGSRGGFLAFLSFFSRIFLHPERWLPFLSFPPPPNPFFSHRNRWSFCFLQVQGARSLFFFVIGDRFYDFLSCFPFRGF